MQDLQSAWLLLSYCGGPRANYYLRLLTPALVQTFAADHDGNLTDCLCKLLRVSAED